MADADFLIIGGGVAGLSAGARLAAHGRVVLVEAEEALGFHSSGRSATFSHFGIGNATVRALTRHSRTFFLEEQGGALGRRASALFVATEAMRADLAALRAAMEPHSGPLADAGEAEMRRLFPPLRVGADAIVEGLLYEDGLRLDSDALLQHYRRAIQAAGGSVETGRRVAAIERRGEAWSLCLENGKALSAPVLVNAAGAWADRIAALAGLAPIGLRPLRRTIILVDPPAGADVSAWPFVKTAVDDFYILPEAGRLMASPVDEVESEPGDAQPEEHDLALAAWKVEQYTTLKIARIPHRWAGHRTFAPDRTPVAGPDPAAPGFFWLAGQGGYGLQTAPAMAEALESRIVGTAWPEGLTALGVGPEQLSPERFART